MERNEIKLREQLVSGDIRRHRNYAALMKRHKRSRLFRRTVRYFLYSLAVAFLVLLLISLSYYVIQMKKSQEQKKQSEPIRTSYNVALKKGNFDAY